MERALEIRQIAANEAPMPLLLEADPSPEAVGQYLYKEDALCFGAFVDGRIAGELVLIKTMPFTCEIVNVAVAEQHRGKGIGKRLVCHAVEQARAMNMAEIVIGTGNPGVAQLMLYQKCGFRIMSVDLDYFTKRYAEPIYENGLLCRDMIRLHLSLKVNYHRLKADGLN